MTLCTRLSLCLVVLMLRVSAGQAAPVEILLEQAARHFHNSGTITLRDPISDEVLGVYQFGTGGLGRGSAPFATYELGEFLRDPDRWNLHQVGHDDGEVWDESIKDMRTAIQLHRLARGNETLGCLGVIADAPTWRRFIAQMQYIESMLGTVSFELTGNPDGTDSVADADTPRKSKRN